MQRSTDCAPYCSFHGAAVGGMCCNEPVPCNRHRDCRAVAEPARPWSVFPSRGAAGAGVPSFKHLLLELQFRLRLQPDETNSAPFLCTS